MPNQNKYYTLCLPVFKQGDDLQHHLEVAGDNATAFVALAEQYEAAATICRKVSAVMAETPGVEVSADTHHIGLSVASSEKGLDGLVSDQVIYEEECDEDEEFEGDDLEDDASEDED